MNNTYIVTTYCVIEDILSASGYKDDVRASVSGAEILFVALIAAKYFQNHHERALYILVRLGDIPSISISRFNRRLHQLRDWLYDITHLLADLFTKGEIFVIDSMPLPVCKRARARRCRKVRGKVYCGYCSAKKEKFFGWRLHLICDPNGIPITFDLLPASLHDLTPIHELTAHLPTGSSVFGDKAYISAKDAQTIFEDVGIRIVAIPRKNMPRNSWADEYDMKQHRKRIETVYSQLEKMGIQRIHARTNEGFHIKTWASLLALTFTNIIN